MLTAVGACIPARFVDRAIIFHSGGEACFVGRAIARRRQSSRQNDQRRYDSGDELHLEVCEVWWC
jgi:hypothetical protein